METAPRSSSSWGTFCLICSRVDGRTEDSTFYLCTRSASIISINCHAQQIKSIGKFKFSLRICSWLASGAPCILFVHVRTANTRNSVSIRVRERCELFDLDYNLQLASCLMRPTLGSWFHCLSVRSVTCILKWARVSFHHKYKVQTRRCAAQEKNFECVFVVRQSHICIAILLHHWRCTRVPKCISIFLYYSLRRKVLNKYLGLILLQSDTGKSHAQGSGTA